MHVAVASFYVYDLTSRRISVASLTFKAGFPQTDFDTKLVNFFLKNSVILKELQLNFLISTLRLFQKLSHK